MQVILPLSIGDYSLESPDPSEVSEDLTEPTTSEEVLDGSISEELPVETTSEEVLELPSEELAEELYEVSSEEILEGESTEYVTEVIYQSEYSSEDLLNIENSLNNVHGALQIIACLLVVIIVYIVLKLCRSILDTLGF